MMSLNAGFDIGFISIRWYSIMILLGVLIGFLLASLEAKKHDLPKDYIIDVGFWVVLCGLLGARVYYVIFNFSYYKQDLWEVFKVWHGGLAIHGSIIGGLIALLIYCKKTDVNPVKIMDIAVFSLILGQAIGRWGNFFNGEAHGPMTSLENLQRLHIPNFVIKGMYLDGVYYHPTFLYESLWCLLGFVILLLIRRYYKNLKIGQLTCVYMMWYGVGRFFIESLRTDSLMLGGIKAAQLISIAFIVIGVIGFIYLCFNKLRKGLYYDKGYKRR